VEQDWLRRSDEIEQNSGNWDDRGESEELGDTDDDGKTKGKMVRGRGDETGRGEASQIKDRQQSGTHKTQR
jgi:hypothetical protein